MIPAATGDAAEVRLGAVTGLASAIADGMSLALANMGLREKLRNQALRDPLTGLYNRRYMEDALDRYISLAERDGSPLAVVMIGGLITSTLFTLLVLPAFYVLVHRLEEKLRARARGVSASKPA